MMFLHESVRHCTKCDEKTPHSHRFLSVPGILALALLPVAGLCLLRDGIWPAVGWALLLLAIVLYRWDRLRFLHVRCERCREKKLAQHRRTRPTLDGNTEINIL